MARTIEVKRVGMKKYDNSLHVRYHSEIYGIVKQYDLTKIGLTTALMDEWNGDINLEGDINKEAGMNVNTERMLKKDEERGKLQELLDAGFIDTFRHFYPDQADIYSWWSYRYKARERNSGWRIDYFVASERLAPRLQGAAIHTEIYGSDHCPVELILD